MIGKSKCVPSKFHSRSSKILVQLSVLASQRQGWLTVNITALTHTWGTCALVPWAQLQSLMVCTGESLQWLPPHGPLNTSGHMVCSMGRERVNRMEPDPPSALQDVFGLFLAIELARLHHHNFVLRRDL